MTTEQFYEQSNEIAVINTYLKITIAALCLILAALEWATWHELHRHFYCLLPISK